MPKASGKTAAKAPAPAAEPAAASSGEKATGGLGLLSSMYGDDDDDDEEAAAIQAARASSSTMLVQAAPFVMAEAPKGHELAVLDKGTVDKKTSQTVVYHNPGYETMWADTQGPSLSSHEQRMAGIKAKNHYTGHVASYNPSSQFAFDEQYHTFNAHGYALNPNTGHDARQSDAQGPGQAPQLGVVGDVDKWAEARGGTVFNMKGPLESSVEETRKRMRLDEAGVPLESAAPELTAEQTAAIEAQRQMARTLAPALTLARTLTQTLFLTLTLALTLTLTRPLPVTLTLALITTPAPKPTQARHKEEKKKRRDEQNGRDNTPAAAMEASPRPSP